MRNKVYLQNIQNLKEEIYKTRFDEIENLGLLGTYMTVSANLLTYLPQMNMDNQYKLIQDIQFHRAVSNVDQYYLELLDKLKIIGETNIIEQSRNSSHIFVTYHTGSYRLFIQHLIQKEVPFCLVTEERFIEDQGATVRKIVKEMRGNDKELEILPAENPRLIFELMSRIKRNISIVFYIDGNTGVKEKKLSENNNLLKIDFLNHHIYARQGIAFLAYLSKAPLTIAVAKRNKNLTNSIRLKIVDTEKLIRQGNRDVFINDITKNLYKELDGFLRKYPEQWEGWFYVDKFFENNNSIEMSNKKISLLTPMKLVLDQYLHLFNYNNKNYFLVSRKDYKIMKITQSLFEILNNFKEPKLIHPNKTMEIAGYNLDNKLISELLEMNLLKKAS